MKSLYIECKMGAAGDMLTAALLGLINEGERSRFLDKVNSLGLSGVEVVHEETVKQGITGNKVNVLIDGEAEGEGYHNEARHTTLRTINDVETIINGLNLSDKVKADAVAVYNLIAEAESKVHGTTVTDIHFHEVGTMDAIADVVSVCILMDMLCPDKVVVSPINVGSGYVKCAHGTLPVPTPATALLLQNIPMYSDERSKGELCTPTGAAVIRYFADEFGSMPVMNVEGIGIGFGTKEFEALNAVRVFLGEPVIENNGQDAIIELKCNIDDMTAEDIGYAVDKLFKDGADDAFTTPIYMKKGRPASLLTVLCHDNMRDRMVRDLFKYTTTIGVRETICERYVLDRQQTIMHTKYGDVRIKEVEGYGVKRSKIEYDDIARLAEDNGVSSMEIRQNIDI